MDFDQLEAVVESISRLEDFHRSAYCMDTFISAQADQKAVKNHLDSLSNPDHVPQAEKAVPFSDLQKQISALGI